MEDILENARLANAFVANTTVDQMGGDTKTVMAVERALEIIGEATKHLPIEFREEHPEIPWKPMAGLRDVVTHQYRTVDLAVIYKAASEEVSVLMDRLPEIIADLESKT